ncbi:type I restriction endonuclease subunit R [Promicromonospora sp. NPDC023987]|uniref:type I restriction endonuclease subunit R n=1 Tax=Promicromonospora sp. NPDC023987 TaxID=3155360 RepID=UPI0033E6479D
MHGTESEWEHRALEYLGTSLMWERVNGTEIAPGATSTKGHPLYAASGAALPQRESWDEVAIPSRLRAAMGRLNPGVPTRFLDQALLEILRPTSQDAITENKRIHDILTNGYPLTYIEDGRERTPSVRLVSDDVSANEYLAVNQVTVRVGDVERRFDVVLYVNGMPVVVIELKNAGDEHATVATAHAQVAGYVRALPLAFRFCVLTLVSDGVDARYGTPFTPLNHFSPWNVDDDGAEVTFGAQVRQVAGGLGVVEDDQPLSALEVALEGLFNQQRFGQLLHGFVAFSTGDDGLVKRIAKPHQYFAVTKAVGATVQAVGDDGRAGVVWHTQGSGKSMEMELYANQVARHPELLNPTIVVVTDRSELDGQLHQTFESSALLPEVPRRVLRRAELRQELGDRVSGGIYFTTLQKFSLTVDEKRAGHAHPVLSARRNIVLIVDEAHRSHYDDLDGYAWHLKNALPNATLIAFTGTPISERDRDTKAVFGDVIDVYDLTRAVRDGATVPVYFEQRMIRVALDGGIDAETIDATADEVTAGLDDAERDRLQKSVAAINAIYGAPARLEELAQDLVTHWEARRDAMVELVRDTVPAATSATEPPVVLAAGAPGKALVVCSTREICARLYDQIVALRPDWHSPDLAAGRIKVVYSGDTRDQAPISDHVRRDQENATIRQRLKDPTDPLEIVIVKDMMLTGYDSPSLHTLYLDRPMRGALLMQTLARVNRTFRGKDAGLLVGYAPVADNLREALAEYTDDDRREKPVGRTVEDAEKLARELIAQIADLVDPSGWRARLRDLRQKSPHLAWTDTLLRTLGWLRSPDTPGNRPPTGAVPDGGDQGFESRLDQFRRRAAMLNRAWALAGRAAALRDVAEDVRFYEELRICNGKQDARERQATGQPIPEEVLRLLGQLVATSVESDSVVDIYEEAGLATPRLDQLDGSYLERAQKSENQQLAVEALRDLVAQETVRLTDGNIVRRELFSERLQKVMLRYTNTNLTSAEVIVALFELAQDLAKEEGRAAELDLSVRAVAFYDVLRAAGSVGDVLDDSALREVAEELTRIVNRDTRTDWTVRDDVKAKLFTSVNRLLAKHRYPADLRQDAVVLVLKQMAVVTRQVWAS